VSCRLPIYVIHWNAPDWCVETVEALLASTTVQPDVTVIDNASSCAVPTFPRGVTLECLRKNIGYSGGANRALELFRRRTEPFCCITSHDVHVSPDALELCVRFADGHPDYGILGLNGEGLSGGLVHDQDWISGTFLFLRRACVSTVGDFDQTYGSYVEDIDYCHRARAAGWKVGIVVSARATSQGSVDGRSALILTRANLTLLAAKEGRRRVVVVRVMGMVLRSITNPCEEWPGSLLLTIRKLVFWGVRHWIGPRPRCGNGFRERSKAAE
jgi:GT2 family glycosyltransferase